MAKPQGVIATLGAKRLLHSNYYMITFTNHRKLEKVNVADLKSNFLKAFTPYVKDYAVEAHGLYNQSHIHGIVNLPTGFYRKKYARYGIYSTHFQVINDQKHYQRSVIYIHKNQ